MNDRKEIRIQKLPHGVSLPEMILFDYGHTLLQEPGWNLLHGIEALMKYATKNRDSMTAADILPHIEKFMNLTLTPMKQSGYDVKWQTAAQYFGEYFGIELSIPLSEAESVYWYGESAGAIMPGADEMLRELGRMGIRYGVVSNLSMSGHALSERIRRLLPDSRPEFVITSSDYIFRKPDPMIFELALRKANISPEKVWFCGDNPQADIEGASGAGIFPVWYDSEIECPYRDKEREMVPKCTMLHVRSWSEFVSVLKMLKK